MDEKTLKQLYWKKGMSLRDIAKNFGIKNHKTISYYFNKFSIPRREATEYSKNTFKQKPIIKKIISNTLKGISNINYITEVKKNKTSYVILKGKSHPMYGKKQSKKQKDKARECMINKLKFGMCKYDTDIERKVENYLMFNNILYIKQHMYKLGVADFWLPESNLIIECNGDYWHSNHKVIKRDEKQVMWLENNDYKVLTFKGSDILNNFTKVEMEILNEI